MKKRIVSVFGTFIMMGVFFLLPDSCEKEELPETVQDIDGNIYHTLSIGSQLWMVENLEVTRYRNGDSIGTTDPATLDITSETNPRYQWAYEGKGSNIGTYGRLYTWYTITDSRGVCPAGWHVPTDADFAVLLSYVSGINVTDSLAEFLGGYRNPDGVFDSIRTEGHWWSATAVDALNAWDRNLNHINREVKKSSYDKSYGFSVKCLWD